MNWEVVRIVIAVLAVCAVFGVIIGMIVGAVRSTRGGSDWSAQSDRGFMPWNDDDT